MSNNKENSIETIRKFIDCVGYDPIAAEFLHQREDGMISCAFRMGNLATFMDSRMGIKKAERLRFDIAMFILEAVEEKLEREKLKYTEVTNETIHRRTSN